MRQKIAACFTAFVQDISDDVDCDEDDKVSKSEMMERIEPGIIEHLPTGKTITFTNPPSVENYKEFTSSQLRAIASGLGITYETISSDLAEVNFSAGRMGHLEMNRNIETWRQNIIIDDFLKPTVKEFLDMLTIIGEMVPANLTTEYIAPRREMIDPTKEIPALVTLIRAGLESRESVIAALGSDPDTVNKAIKKSNDLIDKNGFVFDTDPRNTAANGKLQQINNSSEVDDATESEQTGDQ
jgi:lambda family phage portal protein